MKGHFEKRQLSQVLSGDEVLSGEWVRIRAARVMTQLDHDIKERTPWLSMLIAGTSVRTPFAEYRWVKDE